MKEKQHLSVKELASLPPLTKIRKINPMTNQPNGNPQLYIGSVHGAAVAMNPAGVLYLVGQPAFTTHPWSVTDMRFIEDPDAHLSLNQRRYFDRMKERITLEENLEEFFQ